MVFKAVLMCVNIIAMMSYEMKTAAVNGLQVKLENIICHHIQNVLFLPSNLPSVALFIYGLKDQFGVCSDQHTADLLDNQHRYFKQLQVFSVLSPPLAFHVHRLLGEERMTVGQEHGDHNAKAQQKNSSCQVAA